MFNKITKRKLGRSSLAGEDDLSLKVVIGHCTHKYAGPVCRGSTTMIVDLSVAMVAAHFLSLQVYFRGRVFRSKRRS